jgi:GNAT superfamily N-acetyltransferase
MDIRPAVASDASALVGLCHQLGHAVSLAEAEAHLQQRTADATGCILVALQATHPVGWLEVEQRSALPTGRWAEISGLVVEESLRGQGIGQQLVLAAKKWAQQRGLGRLRVRMRLGRERASRFYQKAGFQLAKQQHVFDVML